MEDGDDNARAHASTRAEGTTRNEGPRNRKVGPSKVNFKTFDDTSRPRLLAASCIRTVRRHTVVHQGCSIHPPSHQPPPYTLNSAAAAAARKPLLWCVCVLARPHSRLPRLPPLPLDFQPGLLSSLSARAPSRRTPYDLPFRPFLITSSLYFYPDPFLCEACPICARP